MMSVSVAVCVCVILGAPAVCHAWIGSDNTGLAFQAENQLTQDSHASLQLSPPPGTTTQPNITDLSVCLWVKVLQFKETSSYVFSYATTDKDNNELNLGIKSEKIVMAVGGKYLYGNMDSEMFIPDSWYHICFVANSTNETATFFVNGEVLNELRLTARDILLNGTLVLGQESDTVGGGYVAEQSFSGIVTAFNLYSRSLSEEEVWEIAKCDVGGQEAGLEGDLVSWTSTDWILTGPVTQQDLTPQYCSQDRHRFVVFTQQRSHDDNEEFCHSLKSSLGVPHNDEENTQLYEAVVPFKDQCQPHNHASAFFLLGAVNKPMEKQWLDYEGKRLNYTNFDTEQTLKSTRCVGFLKPPAQGKWTDISCKLYIKFCAACHQRHHPIVLRMRGLCEQHVISSYFRIEQQLGKVASLRGFTKYYISRDDNATWTLINTWTDEVVAITLAHHVDLPLGRRQWSVANDFALCGQSEGEMHTLSLSACHEKTEFACGDGTCIQLSQRCNMRVDCPDNTDETGCDKLILPEEYLKDLPPPALTPGPLALTLNANIQGISEVDIVNMKLTVDFQTIITWFDQRLTFQNLKPFSDLNYLRTDSVWTPMVDFVNADFPETYTTIPILKVLRESNPEPDDITRPQHDEVFEGGKNPLQRRQKVSAPFSCKMDLRNFPFDSQQCHLHLRLSSANQDFLVWQNLSVEYLGEVQLTEYEVGVVTGDVRQTGGGYSQVTVTINFQRRYSYYFTSAYLPILMLMFISYASLYCPRDNMDLRVMMALTTLLVLFALYQQISDTLPRTSYVKAIDVWCFFAITFIFSQVVLHVAIDVRLPCLRPLKSPPSSSKVKVLDINKRRSGRVLVAARVLYALLLLVFCVTYWGVLLS
ncbi:hypothetical protein Pmani_026213 [Petrolisthes manimaculis]|uniref:Pentraxin (PTX) domain-containing protein n=1 Tax=Petrolisthes manimaculis TaxID=1843537 RepID=A0AAE1U0B3_9EUCA|nr:hypothetical protein Pmani_026213 [Petrolisthes manimaculis]